ncbi:hypothetical protein K1719_043860 [Acacia pycnantha]|nr:hypothetical protein K1719_043860 [Acacia pycnantha]
MRRKNFKNVVHVFGKGFAIEFHHSIEGFEGFLEQISFTVVFDQETQLMNLNHLHWRNRNLVDASSVELSSETDEAVGRRRGSLTQFHSTFSFLFSLDHAKKERKPREFCSEALGYQKL